MTDTTFIERPQAEARKRQISRKETSAPSAQSASARSANAPSAPSAHSASAPSAHSASAPSAQDKLKQAIQTRARKLGFEAIGFTAPEGLGDAGERLQQFLADGHHGDMQWLEQHADRRANPRRLMPAAKTVIMLGTNYGPTDDPLLDLADRSKAVVSTYAKRRDYHDVLKGRLKEIAQLIATRSGQDVKVFVDTAPLMEKPLAQAAGLGWQGKHTNLVSRSFGSWLFLGAILTEAYVAPDAPVKDHCGGCTRCLDACPTNAFVAPYRLDARRCIAYLTIEYGGIIPQEFRQAIGNRVFGCDDCLAVCPWNKFAQDSRDARLAINPACDNPAIADILALDDAAFRKRFAGTPLKRSGRNRLIRNALIAAGNSSDPTLRAHVEPHLSDPDKVVRASAVWAFQQLASSADIAAKRQQHLTNESDPEVQLEWTANFAH